MKIKGVKLTQKACTSESPTAPIDERGNAPGKHTQNSLFTDAFQFNFLLPRPNVVGILCHSLGHLKHASRQRYVAYVRRLRRVVALNARTRHD